MPILTCPSDFSDHAPTKTNRQLADKYGVGEKTITRWRKETGCTATIRPFASAALPKQHVPSISPGLASEAAQFLRKRIVQFTIESSRVHSSGGNMLWGHRFSPSRRSLL